MCLVIPPQAQDLLLLNLMRFPSAQLSSLSRSHWMAAWPSGVSAVSPSFVSSAKLLRVHSIPSCRSLIKMLNKIGPSLFLENIASYRPPDSWATGEPEVPKAIAQYFNAIQNQRRFSWNSCCHLKPFRNKWDALLKEREGWLTGGLLPISHTMIFLPARQKGQTLHNALWEWPYNTLGKC